eukprot:Gb_06802 [translate_table: standard]
MMGEYYYRYKVTALSSCQQSVSGAMSRSISYGTFDLYKTKFRFFPYDALRWGGRPAPPYYRFKVSMFPGGRFKAIALDLGRRRPGLDHCGLRLLGNTPSLNEGGTLQEMSSIRTPFHWLFNPYAGFLTDEAAAVPTGAEDESTTDPEAHGTANADQEGDIDPTMVRTENPKVIPFPNVERGRTDTGFFARRPLLCNSSIAWTGLNPPVMETTGALYLPVPPKSSTQAECFVLPFSLKNYEAVGCSFQATILALLRIKKRLAVAFEPPLRAGPLFNSASPPSLKWNREREKSPP